MSYTTQMLTGLAQLLHDGGAGVYRPDSPYLAGERAIVFGPLPSTPDEAIGLTRYLDVPGILAINTVRVQIRSRVTGGPLAGEALVDLNRDLLHDKTHIDLGGIRFNRIVQESFAPLGPDDNDRLEYVQNFTLTGNRYSPTSP